MLDSVLPTHSSKAFQISGRKQSRHSSCPQSQNSIGPCNAFIISNSEMSSAGRANINPPLAPRVDRTTPARFKTISSCSKYLSDNPSCGVMTLIGTGDPGGLSPSKARIRRPDLNPDDSLNTLNLLLIQRRTQIAFTGIG